MTDTFKIQPIYGRRVDPQNIPNDVLKIIEERLSPEAWEILDVTLSGINMIIIRALRKKDKRIYEGKFSLLGGELELRRVM